ncbi:hypothetical protein B0A49_01940 [Cryomyces minteri]|uniref:3',5'-cyclic-nucleotide phosphodiesterase n=1 Tax=Cryomyces minteri TaxID=331657 RepID=A0A4U0XN90_9PEZI|nr:hypothetical protein B0A49_01940 [Cryomyces minteri]
MDFPLISKDSKRKPNGVPNGTEDGTRETRYSSPQGASRSPSTSLSEFSEPETTLLERGPFAGMSLPNTSARANAAHIVRSHVSTYLITHPHLDHLSGFAINTAAFHATSLPKRLAALPFTINAIKQHIFNDVIWPNLTDEDGGVGFVTFQRLIEGGNVMVGEGRGRGYIEVCDGLGVKGFGISHGNCMKGAGGSNASGHAQRGSNPDSYPRHASHGGDPGRSLSISQISQPGTPGGTLNHNYANNYQQEAQRQCVVDSSAYFIRDSATSHEILVFGDVEPDSLSLSPRTNIVWAEAAPKIAAGVLRGVFIECSYDDGQSDATLFGHLAPRHLVSELQNLAGMVKDAKLRRSEAKKGSKRKRDSYNGVTFELTENEDRKRRSIGERAVSEEARRKSLQDEPENDYDYFSSMAGDAGARNTAPHTPPQSACRLDEDVSTSPRTVTTAPALRAAAAATEDLPLKRLKVVVIHVKDTLTDGPHVSENILKQLDEHEAELRHQGIGLGCEFVISESGASYWF